MSELILTPNIDAPDDFYAELLEAHNGLTKAESDAFNAGLILVMANHIGDLDIISEALKVASKKVLERVLCNHRV